MNIKDKIDLLRDYLQSNRGENLTRLIDLVEIPTKKEERLASNKKAESLISKIVAGELEPTEDIKLELLKFTGYGGLGGLDNDEYYTPKEVAEGAWNFIDVNEGDVFLEPASGIGVFAHTAPKGVKLKGCDLNPISAKIADVTADNANIQAGISFEEYSKNITPNSLDGVITNVPFGNRDTQLKSLDRDYKDIARLEDYFILKSLDLLKYGKKAVFLTSSSTAQRANRKDIRLKFLEKASFIGGLRLPSAMFADTGTEQVVDILVFEKHPKEICEAIEKDTLDWQSWKEIIDKSINRDFIDGKYFDKNPKQVIGKFISREELIKQAEENGEAIHHLAQRDKVELPDGKTIEDIKKEFKSYVTKFNNDLDYKALRFTLETNKSDSVNIEEKLDSAIDFVNKMIDTIKQGNLSKLPKDDEYREQRDILINNGIKLSYTDEKILYAYDLALTLKPSDLFKYIFFANKIEPNVLIDNEKIIKRWLNKRIKQNELNDIVVEAYSKVSKFSFEDKRFIEDISIEIAKAEQNKIFAKKEKIKGFRDVYKIEDFTVEELKDDSVLIAPSGEVYKLADYMLYNNGKSYKELMQEYMLIEEMSPLSKEEWEEKRAYLLKTIKKDFTDRTNTEDYTVPISFIYKIFGEYEGKKIKDSVNNLESIKKAIESTIISELSKIEDIRGYEEKTLRDFKDWSAFGNYVDHIFFNDNLRLIKKDAWLPYEVRDRIEEKGGNGELVRNRVRSIIIEGYTKYTPAIQEYVNTKIKASKKLRELLDKYLEEQRNISYTFNASDGRLDELSGLVSREWINKARHYQNKDIREFAKTQQSVIAYDTGLGKASTAIMLSMMSLKVGSATRVAYVVPNAIFGKIKDETQSVLTKEALNKTLFIESKTANELNRLKTDKNIQFVVFAHSALLNLFKLKDETVKIIWGRNPKEENTNSEDINYSQNNLRAWIKKYPTYSKNATHFFEDSGIDMIIIDEAHHYKNAVASVSAGVKGLTSTTSNEAVVMLSFVEYIKGVKRGDMKGCVLTTATPATSSPTEIETALLFSTDRQGLKSVGVFDAEDFENTFFNIERRSVLKTDGVSYVDKKVLTGLKNLDTLRRAGLSNFKFRFAEIEESFAKEKGYTISVKPPSKEFECILGGELKDDFNILSAINADFAPIAREFNKGTLDINEGNKWDIVLAKEFGEIFGFIDKATKLSISKEYAIGYTPINLKDNYTEDEVLKVIGSIKVEVRQAEIFERKGITGIDIKKAQIPLKDYYTTEYYIEKSKRVPYAIKPLVEGNVLYLPTTSYTSIKQALTKLEKAKMVVDPFSLDKYPKLHAVIDNIKKEIKRHPKAKQIIYSTALGTHMILDRLIKSNIKECKKIWHFSGEVQKNSDAKLKVQEDFNTYDNMGIMIFGKAGQVGVDFNKNVCAVHLVDIGQTPDARHQAKGRAVRQGNKIDKVHVYNYLSKDGFDIFLADLVKNKADWIESLRKKDVKSTDFTDDTIEYIATQAEIKFAHLDIPAEEKIRKYIELQEKEKEDFRKALKNALIDEALSDISKFKKDYIGEYADYSEDKIDALNLLYDIGHSYYYSTPYLSALVDDFNDDNVNTSSFADSLEYYFGEKKIAYTLYLDIDTAGKEKLKKVYEDAKELHEILKETYFRVFKDDIEKIEEILKDNSKKGSPLYNKAKTLLSAVNNDFIGYIDNLLFKVADKITEIAVNAKNKDEILGSMIKKVYEEIGDTEYTVEEFADKIDDLVFNPATNSYVMPPKNKDNFKIKEVQIANSKVLYLIISNKIGYQLNTKSDFTLIDFSDIKADFETSDFNEIINKYPDYKTALSNLAYKIDIDLKETKLRNIVRAKYWKGGAVERIYLTIKDANYKWHRKGNNWVSVKKGEVIWGFAPDWWLDDDEIAFIESATTMSELKKIFEIEE